MIKALPAFGGLRPFFRRQHGNEFCAGVHGVDHDSFCRSGMHTAAGDLDFRGGSVEGLILVPAQMVSVQGIGKFRSKPFQIQVLCKTAHLFVGRKSKTDAAMQSIRMVQKIFCHGHNGCNGSLVVSSKKGGAVRQDQILSDVGVQIFKL